LGADADFFCKRLPLSIIFVGLPGSGKTTIGRQLARRLGQPFVDSDHEIEHRLGCSIREFFAREGEDSFRNQEQQVIDELTQTHQGVILVQNRTIVLFCLPHDRSPKPSSKVRKHCHTPESGRRVLIKGQQTKAVIIDAALWVWPRKLAWKACRSALSPKSPA
jgi:hypothetical protein